MKKIYRIINLVILFSILLSIKCFAVRYPTTLTLDHMGSAHAPWNTTNNTEIWCRRHGAGGTLKAENLPYKFKITGTNGKEMPEILAGWLHEVKNYKDDKTITDYDRNLEIQKIIWHQTRRKINNI